MALVIGHSMGAAFGEFVDEGAVWGGYHASAPAKFRYSLPPSVQEHSTGMGAFTGGVNSLMCPKPLGVIGPVAGATGTEGSGITSVLIAPPG
jgi:hypothetical protein